MAVINTWNNGLVGSEYIRINQQSTRKRKNIYVVKNKYGSATYDLSGYSNSQRKRFVKRILSGYNEKVDFSPAVIEEINSEEE